MYYIEMPAIGSPGRLGFLEAHQTLWQHPKGGFRKAPVTTTVLWDYPIVKMDKTCGTAQGMVH